MANPFDQLDNTEEQPPVTEPQVEQPTSTSSNPWDALDDKRDVIKDKVKEALPDEEKIEKAADQVEQRVGTLIDYFNVATQAIKRESGKGNAFEGALFIIGRDGMPKLEEIIEKAIELAKLPPVPDWVYDIPGGVGGAMLDAIIVLGPTKFLPPQARLVVNALIAVSWGAAVSGPILEGWIVAKFGEGTVGQEIVNTITKILAASNPRLILYNAFHKLKDLLSGPVADFIKEDIAPGLEHADKLLPKDPRTIKQDPSFKENLWAPFFEKYGGIEYKDEPEQKAHGGWTNEDHMRAKFYSNGGKLESKVRKVYNEGYKAPGQAYAIAKSMGYAYGGKIRGSLPMRDKFYRKSGR